MLFQSIELVNFRQFVNEKIEFSTEKDKNVTIIKGENGSGKTTFAQAFFWCLYGGTNFNDKTLVNRLPIRINEGNHREVRVTIVMQCGEGLQYTITRSQNYLSKSATRWEGATSNLKIIQKNSDGSTQEVKKPQDLIEEILPQALSEYFFFDGERINAISKQLAAGRKCASFSDAVKGLTGLQSMQRALEHLNPNSAKSVMKLFDQDYRGDSKARLELYGETIEKAKKRLNQIELDLKDCDSEIANAEDSLKSFEAELREFSDSRKKQEEKDDYNCKIALWQGMQSDVVKDICSYFQNTIFSFLAQSLLKSSLEEISESDCSGMSIPNITATTINFLLKRGTCICGANLVEGEEAYRIIEDLKRTLPPLSISNSINEFTKRVKDYSSDTASVITQIVEKLRRLEEFDSQIEEAKEKVLEIDEFLGGENVSQKVQVCQKRINECKQVRISNQAKHDRLIEERGRVSKEKERQETERQNLALATKDNLLIEACRDCVKRVYEKIYGIYSSEEVKVKTVLEETINKIFKEIYDGGLSLTIDDKYNVSVYVQDYAGEDVETSQAQNLSVVFAFISAIIKMAKDKRDEEGKDSECTTETYPLVMDAPLSAFDKRRIKSICSTIPEIAEQVIIFIKDTDGDLAEEYLGSRVGVLKHFVKYGEFKTQIQNEGK